jgi:hypothetical protein
MKPILLPGSEDFARAVAGDDDQRALLRVAFYGGAGWLLAELLHSNEPEKIALAALDEISAYRVEVAEALAAISQRAGLKVN